jgi:hypothetical protein
MQHGTISLWRLAAYVTSAAQMASVQRLFYRFFQFVRLDGTHSARVMVELLGLSGKPWVLAIDRTNWDFGKTTINILTISVAWNGMGIPLLWMLLPTAGNSNTAERTELLDRLGAAFPDMKIAARRAIARSSAMPGWPICSARTPLLSCACARNSMWAGRSADLRHCAASQGQRKNDRPRRLPTANETLSASVRLTIMRLASGELLALACSGRARHALARYRQRWTIETRAA